MKAGRKAQAGLGRSSPAVGHDGEGPKAGGPDSRLRRSRVEAGEI